MPSPDSAVTIPGSAHAASKETIRTETFPERYALGDALGEGGMGVVRACRDQRIGREVALKTTRGEHSGRGDIISRFIREACVQGQLEHPAIVPVYDLDRDPDGNFYFTMKRVRGATFEQIVIALKGRDARAQKLFSRRKLLVAFASVCQALQFAHARGVIHRDLKPGNVMLGDFGEVYVLDWGLAKLPEMPDPPAAAGQAAAKGGVSPAPKPGQTEGGAALGTPGYMAPEQVLGERVDARTDVYSLGAILFELLALEPLHPPASREATYSATLVGTDARPSVRSPSQDIPPELDEICVRATALSSDARFQTVRDMLDAVERYLDGDRDLQRRREMALHHARAAAGHAERALSGRAGATAARSLALQDVGRAITFDPTNADALRTLVRLLTEPPREIPPEARAELVRAYARNLATGGRAAGYAFLIWFLFTPLALWMGIRSWRAATMVTVAWLAAAVISFLGARRPEPSGRPGLPILVAGATAIACTVTLFGPFFFLPGLVVIYGMMFSLVPPDRSRRWIVFGLCFLAVVGPALLGWAGVLPQPYELHEDAITIHAGMLHFPPVPTLIFLTLTSLAIVVTACSMTATVRDALTAAEERLHVQAWQLRQMLPREANLSVPPVEESQT